MAVMVKNETELGKGLPALGWAGASLLGTAYIVAGFLAVYHGIPFLYDWLLAWWTSNVTDAIHLGPFMYQGGRLLLVVAAAAGVIYLWPKLLGDRPGLRAGAAIGVLFVLAGAMVVYLVSYLVQTTLLKNMEQPNSYWAGLGVAVVTAAVWIGFMISTYGKPSFQARLLDIEEQGWFSLKSYKKGQGLRCRRGTMLGLLAIIGAGLWVYALRRNLTINSDWRIDIPFDPHHQLILLYAPALTASVLIAGLGLWFSYRLVNYPRFADFLIATDAELNKVSWSSRKRLVQDTIVVLTTVVLMAVFLLAVDLFWSFILTRIGVIQT